MVVLLFLQWPVGAGGGQGIQRVHNSCAMCFHVMNCPSWAWSSQTASWLGNRLWPYISNPANPIRPNGFIRNNVTARGLTSLASSVDSVNMRLWGGETAGLSMAAWVLSYRPKPLSSPMPWSVKKKLWVERAIRGQPGDLTSVPALPQTGSLGLE